MVSVSTDRDADYDCMCGIHIKGGDADGARAFIEQLVNGPAGGPQSAGSHQPEPFVQIDWQNVFKESVSTYK